MSSSNATTPRTAPRKATWSDTNAEGRWRCFAYEELSKRDELNLDIFWLKDTSLEDADSLPEPDVLAQEISEDLQAAMELFAGIAAELKE
jgi:type I restriction enzyme M protein